MKLINLLTIWYTLITMIALFLGGLLIFKKFESEIDFELGRELDRQIDAYAERIESGAPADRLIYDKLEIREIPYELPLEELYLRDTVAYHDPMNRAENQLKASKSYKIDGKHYRISYYNIVVETEDITETVVITMFSVFLIQLLFLGFFTRIGSNKILRPFHKTLDQIRSFNFQKNEPLHLPENSIAEFEKLNSFLEKMSQKLLNDYRQIKEFSENLSHEIQTPSAIIRGKLEHLMNEQISEKQALMIQSAYQSNEKINKIVRSLSMLAKLENEEFEAPEKIDLSPIVQKIIEGMTELIELKNLEVKTQIQENSSVKIHPFIAEVLIQNLINNAIKHNVEGGKLYVELNDYSLRIENSGALPEKDPEEFFDRFSKGNTNSDSIGLGLSIVKQICRRYNLRPIYRIENNLHVLTILFK
ncbi:sensor histidine kinase [Algoriphagus hitonicola]|uniref:histidine kinase n=1 Tax=Algoriphagus hitonicola TaxID=435880 RepID=A0A1I2WAG6_9BACT|nr:HAMP domain-containing sensor histidine kinase [Algoriphagus hitonicola]SFG96491.1 Signal transduction histidine kinase [Algoriphagus hitonicola]